MIRHQLPVYSPLSLRGLAGALADMAGSRDPRAELESALRGRFGADAVRLCGSGTQALTLSLQIARARLGGDPIVALPAFACFNLATAAVGARIPVQLYDIDPDTLGPDMDSLDAACAAGARVVVVVHFFGLAVDWEALSACAQRHGALLIEDAAQGHGASWRNRPLGSLAPLSVLSFGRGKGWTGGAGGALLLRGEAADWTSLVSPPPGASALGATRALGMAIGQWLMGRPTIYGLPAALPWLGLGETRYEDPRPITLMPATSAALLVRTRAAADTLMEKCRNSGQLWAREVADLPGVRTIQVLVEAQPSYLRFPVRLPGGLAALRAGAPALRLGVAPSYPYSLAGLRQLHPWLRGNRQGFPGADELCRDLITLPTHSLVKPTEHSAILDLLTARSVTYASPRHLDPPSTSRVTG